MQQKAIVNTNWAVVVSLSRSPSLSLSPSGQPIYSLFLLAARVCELIGKLLTTHAYVVHTKTHKVCAGIAGALNGKVRKAEEV